jgi:AraC family transcriptional regulator
MLSNSIPTSGISAKAFERKIGLRPRAAVLLPADQRPRLGDLCFNSADGRVAHPDTGSSDDVANAMVQISPPHAVTRSNITSRAMRAEIIQANTHERIEFRFCASAHMLIVYEEGVRDGGDTFVEGLPRSTLRDLRKKLTFVPAGHAYRECHELRSLGRLTFFYFDPAKMPSPPESSIVPRLYFENAALWDTALKLTRLVESASADNQSYLEALGVVLAHELGRLDCASTPAQVPVRGGLAAWQQRVATTYIEEHLAEPISLTTLARLVRLSPHHFCRAFKQSFATPPHRYHTSRRIERAKILLAKPAPSVTDIGLTLGFSQTSSFTAAFRRATGFTPTGYHRSLA